MSIALCLSIFRKKGGDERPRNFSDFFFLKRSDYVYSRSYVYSRLQSKYLFNNDFKLYICNYSFAALGEYTFLEADAFEAMHLT